MHKVPKKTPDFYVFSLYVGFENHNRSLSHRCNYYSYVLQSGGVSVAGNCKYQFVIIFHCYHHQDAFG